MWRDPHRGRLWIHLLNDTWTFPGPFLIFLHSPLVNLSRRRNRPLIYVGRQVLEWRHQYRPLFRGERDGGFLRVIQTFMRRRSWCQYLRRNGYTRGSRVPLWVVPDLSFGCILIGRPRLGSGWVACMLQANWNFQLGTGTDVFIQYDLMVIVLTLGGSQQGDHRGMVWCGGPCWCCQSRSVMFFV